MSALLRPLLFISLAVLALVLLVLVQAGTLVAFFAENLAVNLMILAVLIGGLVLSYWRLFSLSYEIEWLARIQSAGPASNPDTLAGTKVRDRLDLMASFATLWRRYFDSNQVLSPDLANTLVEGAQARVDERREFSRYLITALVILGLLGTFWGLLGALYSMREALGDLGANQSLLDGLSQSLTGPLENMGTAFSSSLFGLGASLFYGFVEVQTARAQNRFVEGFETWLTSLVQTGSGAGGTGTSASAGPGATFSSQMDERFETLSHLMRRGQQDAIVVNNNLVSLLDKVGRLADKAHGDEVFQEKIASTHQDQRALIDAMTQLQKTMETQVATAAAAAVSVSVDTAADAQAAEPTPAAAQEAEASPDEAEPREEQLTLKSAAGAFLTEGSASDTKSEA